MSDQPVTPETPAAPEIDENQIIAERRAKLQALRAKGIAYPNKFWRENLLGDLAEKYEDRERDWLDVNPVVVKIAGRMMLKRVMGKASFAQLQDSSGSLQLYITDSYPGKEQHAEFKHYDTGDTIGVEGVLFKTKTNELTVRVKKLVMLAKSLRPLPEKFHGLTDQEQCYRQRYLDLIANEDTRLRFVKRSRIVQAIREFFLAKRYLEVETPMMHPIPGGASARPFVTHHNALDMQLYLRIAPELYLKRLVVGGFEKVFEINRNFRNEGISTRHNPEFTMLEFYCAHRDYHYLMACIEQMFRVVAGNALGTTTISYQGREIDLMKPFARITIADAIKKYHPEFTDEMLKNRDALIAKLNELKIAFRPQDGIYGLQLTLFENTVEAQLFEPTYIYHYPAEVSPLARRDDENPDFTERFELYIAGREIANGFSELNDPEDQAQRFLEQAKQKEAGDQEAMHYDADYIRALEYGLPPTAGAGIGIDRLVMLFTDSPSIRDVILFPQMRPGQLRTAAVMTKPVWQPSAAAIAACNMTALMRAAERKYAIRLPDYAALHAWSVDERENFNRLLWEFCGVIAERQGDVALEHRNRMPGARWFPQARLNFAENLLRRRDADTAIVFWGEDRVKSSITYAELYHEVSRLAQALRACGVKPGDRVAAYMPNLPGTVIAMLAATSLGAIWSSCSPDFGVQGVLDRFGQIEPRILFSADGYFYNGKTIDVLPRLAEIARALPSVEKVIVVPYTQRSPALGAVPRAVDVHDFMAPYRARAIEFVQLPFNHPLYIMYSSGTTGVPKCIVHGAGGTLLQHLKEQAMHVDLKRGDRLFYFTTCGWMMWNWLVSGLASGATLLLYDGSPFLGNGRIQFDFADATGMTVFGTSAKFIDAIAKAGLRPAETHQLDTLRVMLSTGSPLVPEGFDYVYAHVKRDINVASMSGGTDIMGTFVSGNPLLPVWRGEIQCATLGMQVDVFDDDGRPLRGAKGELVCTAPFPSMPVGFWNDSQGRKYHAAYFEKYPNVWCHGDYVEFTEHGGIIIYGRSDAVLNPGGVRIGTAEIYRQVEQLDEVVESLVIGQEWPPEQPSDVRVVLFVRLRDGLTLDAALIERIKQHIRANTTPRHVPAKIVQVADIPRTKSGKIVELAVRHIVHNRPVKNIEALANPEALQMFRDRAELKT